MLRYNLATFVLSMFRRHFTQILLIIVKFDYFTLLSDAKKNFNILQSIRLFDCSLLWVKCKISLFKEVNAHFLSFCRNIRRTNCQLKRFQLHADIIR